MPEEAPAERGQLAQKMWQILQESNIKLEIYHYNVMLKAQLDNNTEISPDDVLKEIKERGLKPTWYVFMLCLIFDI